MEKLKYISPTLLLGVEPGDDVIDDPPSQGDDPLTSKSVGDTVDPEMGEDN